MEDIITLLYPLLPQTKWRHLALLNKQTYNDYKLIYKPQLIQYKDFYRACRNGDVEDLKYSLKVVDAEYSVDIGFLHACKGGHLEVVELLLKYGAKWFYRKPLFKACQGGNVKIVKTVIDNLKNNDWEYGVYGACRGGHLEIVKMMEKMDSYNGDKALYWACRGGHIDIVNYIMKQHTYFKFYCSLNYDEGFIGASKGGYLEIVKMMDAFGVNQHSIEEGLKEARHRGYEEIVEYILNKYYIKRRKTD